MELIEKVLTELYMHAQSQNRQHWVEDAKAMLAAYNATAQEPDCWAILTPNGSRLVSPDEAKGRRDAYPLYTAPQPSQPAASIVIGFDRAQDDSECTVYGHVKDGVLHIDRIDSAQPAASEVARDAKDAALQAINDIRNSIIGLQTLNWSEHVYPLVVALDKAGYKGMSYPKARKFYGTMLDRCNRAEADAKRLDFLCDHIVNVREPLRHGSRDMFWASPTDDDSGHTPSNLRTLIDMEIERLDRAEGE